MLLLFKAGLRRDVPQIGQPQPLQAVVSQCVKLAPDRIRVNCICPGGINTPLLHRGSPEAMGQVLDAVQPWPAHGRAEDIASAALFLASDDASFVTGEALVVDGGMMAAGSFAMRSIGGGAAMGVVGMDFGSTGLDTTLKTLD